MTKRVTILQGIPGAGKSSSISPTAKVVSADHFFVMNGKYQFNPRLLTQAHAACLRQYVQFLQAGEEEVVVDNTNTSVAEIAPYYALAEAYGYAVKIHTHLCDAETGAKRNIHGVSLDACERMVSRIERTNRELPPWWVRKDIL